ncbi:LpqN/LpqT family lipoprotein, partial [Mycolicibacter algericus]|uniref:LpqN/LpqT family lipoprotein n=1 Tax=Mycolicibacter algericus TaxID=1288388 RepID=UPI0021F2A5D1
MNTPTKAAGTVVAAVALALALAGCGSDSETQATSSSSESSSASSSSSESSAPQTSAAPAGKRETIADYIKETGITETPVKKGQPDTPTVDLPVPAGWQDAGPRTPQFAYSAMVFTGDPAMAADP